MPKAIPVSGAVNMLTNAAKHIADRAVIYDQEGGERSVGKTITAFNAITGRMLSEAEGWLFLQLLKDARQWSRTEPHADSAEDSVAYAALKAECIMEKGK